MKQLPQINCPVYGVATRYNIDIAAQSDSKELKYRLYGALFLENGPVDITVLAIFQSTEDPNHVYVVYEDSRDGKIKKTFANGIKAIKEGNSLMAAVSEAVDYLCALHHGSSLFIRYPDKKTFVFKACNLNRTIRGNAYYRLYDVQRNGNYVFEVADENRPESKFVLTAESVVRGTWHRVKGTLCPVPGVDPDERTN